MSERTGNVLDLAESIADDKHAIRLTLPDDPKRPVYLNGLSNKLGRMYAGTKNADYLQESIKAAKEAVKLTPLEDPGRYLNLNTLSNKTFGLFKITEAIVDLNESIELQIQAVALNSDLHPDQAEMLNNLGIKLERRFKTTGQESDTKEALEAYFRAYRCPNARPLIRVGSARQTIALLISKKEWKQACELAKQAVGVLSLVNKRSLDLEDKQSLLPIFSVLQR